MPAMGAGGGQEGLGGGEQYHPTREGVKSLGQALARVNRKCVF